MVPRSREKVALVILCLLVACGGFALVGYIFAGHSLNVAATQIDDAFGSMEGYSVIVFEGTVDPDEREEALARASGDEGAGSEAADEDGAGDEAASDGEGTEAAEGEAQQAADSDGEGAEAAEGASQQGADGEGDSSIGEASQQGGDEEGAALQDGEDAATEAADEASASAWRARSSSVTAAEVRDAYREKGADVFSLDVADPVRYRDGLILKQGDRRIGVFSVSGVTTTADIEEMVAYFELNAVEIVVAIAPLAGFLGTTDGVDIVVTTANLTGSTMGGVVDGSYVVQSPVRGSVGVVLISSGNVVSSKVVSEL